ncbi:uncharacterized protein LOC131614437 [Vicia villosa]|uniref:uncharacterized protein LOC131614437 n=1 Tax=Vicia villosa TaxID=3911 RepID=UPI00273B9899|nr:uncharacterized protein LOC131614437 [Vicia villosa]
MVEDRDVSDHCPVWLICDKANWGPKPFKVNIEWFSNKDFLPFVKKEWIAFNVEGRGDIILKEKLRMLKDKLRWWNFNVFGMYDLAVEENVRILNEGDVDMEEDDVEDSFEMIERKKRASKDFWLNLKIKENMLIQKSRLKWLNDGDTNSKFFHGVMKARRTRNFIGSLVKGGEIINSVAEIKEEVKNHFEKKFVEDRRMRPVLDGISFETLEEEDKVFLKKPFKEFEIKAAIWDCDGLKSPGPDGYSFFFIKRCWDFMKVEFINCFKCFHREALLSKSITSSFLTLIPKSSNPLSLDEYRPICLVGCIYKAISKLLASRLKKVLGTTISKCQSAFVPGRQLLDGVMVANEVVDFAKREGIGCLLFKVDFEKAYDKVSWDFLRYLLRRMGFGDTWLKWMEALIFSSKMSVLENGSPTKEFEVRKGLRQGNPISPFLFVIVTEGLRRLVAKAVETGDYVGFNLRRSCSVDIHQFTDDTLHLGEGTWKQIWTIKAILRGGRIATSLSLVSQSESIRGELLHGAELLARSSQGFWIGKLAFYLSEAPKKIIKKIKRLQSRFLWGGGSDNKKINWVSWKSCCLPIDKGGLGLRRIREFNLALLQKWRWRIMGGSEELWYGVLKTRYGDINLQVVKVAKSDNNKSSKSLWWRDILELEHEFKESVFVNLCRFKVGDGFHISFWHSCWLNDCSLKEAFSVAYLCSELKFVSIACMGGWKNNVWKWGDFGVRRGDFPGLEEEIRRLLLVMEGARLDWGKRGERDTVRWEGEPEGIFSVRSCYGGYEKYHIPFGPRVENSEALTLLWHNLVPQKIKSFGWRCFLNRLPIKDLLARRGISLSNSTLCVLCENNQESLLHLLLSCRASYLIWRDMATWIGFDIGEEVSLIESYMRWYRFCKSNRVKKGREGVMWLAIVWSIWNVRNSIIFRGEDWNILDTVWNIKILLWRWSFIELIKKKEGFMKLIEAVEDGRKLEQRTLEQVAMDKLVELAYKKKLWPN